MKPRPLTIREVILLRIVSDIPVSVADATDEYRMRANDPAARKDTVSRSLRRMRDQRLVRHASTGIEQPQGLPLGRPHYIATQLGRQAIDIFEKAMAF